MGAAVLQGAAVVTRDLDLWIARRRAAGAAHPRAPNPTRPQGQIQNARAPRNPPGSPPAYSTTTTGFPSTSIFGVMPSPGAVLADMKPSTRCGAPAAVETVT